MFDELTELTEEEKANYSYILNRGQNMPMNEIEVPFEPLWDYVLIQPIKEEKIGSLHLPEGTKLTKLGLGKVIKSGPGTLRDNGTLIPNPIREGDTIFLMAYKPPFDVMLNGKHYICISGRDVVAIVPRAKE